MSTVLVTATTDPIRALPTLRSWGDTRLIVVVNGSEVTLRHELPLAKWITHPEILGTVPAFAIGVQAALEEGADIIACLHDDLEIHDSQWAPTVYTFLLQHPTVGLVGFGGGRGLGDPDLYQKPYHPMQLARKDFISNMVDAEHHGRRVTVPTRVACLDGFSQIGRREFWQGKPRPTINPETQFHPGLREGNLFTQMQSWGVIHHFYDGMLGAFAKQLGWEVWMLPIRCRHLGGQTAVGDPRYQQWASLQPRLEYQDDFGWTEAKGDQAFWYRAHRIGYTKFKGILPITIEELEYHVTRNPF